MLEAAAARPRATPLGRQLSNCVLHALAGKVVFLDLNGHRNALNNDAAFELTASAAAGSAGDVADIAEATSMSYLSSNVRIGVRL